ncbi:MAG: hypothetical protein COV30_00070 [Candidatus Yanofskybacteria bacterium CG10_big_fil_rev_8_21_14_0_10_37_15]|uniref:Uncharacterized protein n=1 Tax=Candidatus Yanofskybacteria bacterium CG10_big_fil_rev_8_21_14_0_10_37_15 TaxID=1975097 RepID=A0A2H0R6F7_9BACT|nr:MAG: hypothetical protein COV30_00070 [Candidatus Yanofskybacteria bacterium CG10_big_fil_rev_8_21_14_0_10_37_15]
MAISKKRGARKPPMVTLADVTSAFGVEATSASAEERGGTPEKNRAASVDLFTPEVKGWLSSHSEIKTEGFFGPRGITPITEDQFRKFIEAGGNLDELAGPDPDAPAEVVCAICEGAIVRPIQVAIVRPDGNLLRDHQDGVVYRGQAVVTGRPLARHAAHPGQCIYELRDARGKKKTLPNGRVVADLLDAQSFSQAAARLAGIQANLASKKAKKEAVDNRLGFTLTDEGGDATIGDRQGWGGNRRPNDRQPPKRRVRGWS